MGRYCDSRCVNAVSEVCMCRCGGVNHGVGRSLELPIKVEPKLVDPVKLAESKALAEKILAEKLGWMVKL
uniref:Uncharacterized protein n=1 Tax=viral metagenome TaxID=1070528 RepID=A0A6M3KF58_9ZZZZ